MAILEIGATYRTRSGGSVQIRDVDGDRFFGDIVASNGATDRIASFTRDGQYVLGRETEFDIISLDPLSKPGVRRYGVVMERWGHRHLRSDFSTEDRADIALYHDMHPWPLKVAPIDVWYSTNGNIRLWKPAPTHQT